MPGLLTAASCAVAGFDPAIEKLVREARLEAAGIEYVVDKDGNWYIYDINALSILRASFKEQYGIDGWGTLAAFFEAEYLKTLENAGVSQS